MVDSSDVKSIFLAAIEKPPAERAAYLDQAAGSDDSLRQRVEALLQAHDNPNSFLDAAAAAFSPTVDVRREAPLAEAAGSHIGPYKLLEQIGEGGMGVVYMADQQAPVRRRVAVKVIKVGMDSRQVIARFEAERQALALMDHANIARVLDAGATDSGRPYFVMELVRGIPITDYCDQNNLPVHQRLELFVQVCHALQHAHQKGIIHRDLKPTNVLVTLHDGRPVPKVIDFGIAKATGQQLTEKTLFTAFAQMIGTPLYMSPEQAEMTSIDIDTRSDIYSLGVLLYELLTGTTPFDQHRMRAAAFDEVRRIIREEEPPKPSTRLSTLGESRTATAARRQVDSHRLSGLVKGDLDWIVMKALDKDRTRRYDTAGHFAADVLRHLSDQPVEACPPSALYRFRKFARRNKLALATTAVVAASLVLGLVLSIWQATLARRAEALAEVRLQNETEARQQATAEAAKATALSELLQSALAEQLRNAGRQQEVVGRQQESEDAQLRIFRDALLRDSKKLDHAIDAATALIAKDPSLDNAWSLRGDAYRLMREYAKMAEDYSEALRLDPNNWWYWHERGYAYLRLGEHEKSIADHSKAIELSDHDPGQRVRRANSYQALGDFEKATKDYHRAFELADGRLPIGNVYDLNEAAWWIVAYPVADSILAQKAIEMAKKATATRLRDGNMATTLGVAYFRGGDYNSAIEALGKAMELRSGGDASEWFFLAMAHWQLDQKDEARTWYDKAVEWMDNNKPTDEDLRRFRAEAAELLGISEPATSIDTAKQP